MIDNTLELLEMIADPRLGKTPTLADLLVMILINQLDMEKKLDRLLER